MRIHSVKDGKGQGTSASPGIDEGTQLVAAYLKFRQENPLPPWNDFEDWDKSRSRVVQTENEDAMKGKLGQQKKTSK